jgi:transposase
MRVLLVLDNLRVHYAKKLNPIYSNAFKVLFLPPYSSPLNPIERLWSNLKHRWSSNLLLYVDELSNVKDTRSNDQRTKRAMMKLEETIGKVMFNVNYP